MQFSLMKKRPRELCCLSLTLLTPGSYLPPVKYQYSDKNRLGIGLHCLLLGLEGHAVVPSA